MSKVLWLSLGLLFALSFVAIPLGSIAPTASDASPYYSALSDLAVGTADACPCNGKYCNANTCQPDVDPDVPHACCIQAGVCHSPLCFP
jgi:hypothetical protein